MMSRPTTHPSRRRARVGLLSIALLGACLSADPFFFSPVAVDGYDWDADPPDPDLDGQISEVHPSRIGPEDRFEDFVTIDAGKIHYVYARREGADTTIFYSHGNALHLGRYWDRVELMWSWGYNVMIYDYPGFGLSTGEIDEDGLYASARAVLERLPELPGVDPERVIFMGYSMGGAAAVEMTVAAERGDVAIRPRGLVTESTFCSAEALVQDGTFLNLDGDFVTDYELDNCAKMAAIDPAIPRLILHGTDDTFVVPLHATQLARAAGDAATLEWIEGADHTDVPLAQPERYERLLTEFFTLP